jgi:hypothetical protein
VDARVVLAESLARRVAGGSGGSANAARRTLFEIDKATPRNS